MLFPSCAAVGRGLRAARNLALIIDARIRICAVTPTSHESARALKLTFNVRPEQLTAEDREVMKRALASAHD
jgi:hypothetical protein